VRVTVAHTVAPASVSLWLRGSGTKR
jgi:hypothetical protein